MTEAGVYAARFDAAGQLLDPDGLLLSSSAAEQTVCAVAANPRGDASVAWSAPHGTSTTDWDILGTRVRADGTMMTRLRWSSAELLEFRPHQPSPPTGKPTSWHGETAAARASTAACSGPTAP